MSQRGNKMAEERFHDGDGHIKIIYGKKYIYRYDTELKKEVYVRPYREEEGFKNIPDKEYDISDNPLVWGKRVATGWMSNDKGYFRIKHMNNEQLKKAIDNHKRLIRENYDNPDYPKKLIRNYLWVLEQMVEELEEREEWKAREELTEEGLIQRLITQLDVMEVRD